MTQNLFFFPGNVEQLAAPVDIATASTAPNTTPEETTTTPTTTEPTTTTTVAETLPVETTTTTTVSTTTTAETTTPETSTTTSTTEAPIVVSEVSPAENETPLADNANQILGEGSVESSSQGSVDASSEISGSEVSTERETTLSVVEDITTVESVASEEPESNEQTSGVAGTT